MRMTDFRAMVFCCVAGLALGVTFAAVAEDAMIIDKHRDSIISGRVTDVGRETLTLSSADREIRVDLDNMNLDTSATNLIKPGEEVTVAGRFRNSGPRPTFDAEEIVSNSDGMSSTEAAILLRNNRRFHIH